jgi:hypothetical protein
MEGRMPKRGLTAHGLLCLEHLKEARSQGTSLAAYARSHGVNVRTLYDADQRLRKKEKSAEAAAAPAAGGSLAEGRCESGASRFVSVRIVPAGAESSAAAPVLRLRHARGHVLEFGAWPPAEVLQAALSDAAT